MTSPRWTEWFMDFARVAASKSKDPATKVGCVIVGTDHEIRSTGYNGPPREVRDLPERFERPEKYLWVSHAEQNAVAQAARIGVSLRDCTAYVTHHPCAACARSLIQAGVTGVVVGPGQTSMPREEFAVAARMLEEARVLVWHQEDKP